MNPTLDLAWSDWLYLFTHFLTLSLLSVGGGITTAPDMHRFLVDKQGWITDAQYTSSIAIAQAAPGPNILFVALLGWNVGINAGGLGWGLLGVMLCMVGIVMPSSILVYVTARWSHANRELRAVRAFKLGMAPIVIALLIATGWILAGVNADPARHWPLWLLTVITAVIVWRTRLHLLWLLGLGGLLGWFGWV